MKPNHTKPGQLTRSGATSCSQEGGEQRIVGNTSKTSNTYLGHFTLQDTAKKKHLILQHQPARAMAWVGP